MVRGLPLVRWREQGGPPRERACNGRFCIQQTVGPSIRRGRLLCSVEHQVYSGRSGIAKNIFLSRK